METQLKEVALKLHEIGAVKFGEFKLKTGRMSPVYFDLRVIVSYTGVMKSLVNLLIEVIKREEIDAKYVCGVPYTALPVATGVCWESNLTMLMRRKEKKDYGTKKLIEGHFEREENCLIVEDIITSGGSVLETADDLKAEGLLVTTALVIIDREQGGKTRLAEKGIESFSLYTMSSFLDILHKAGKLQEETVQSVLKYIEENRFPPSAAVAEAPVDRLKMSFAERATLAKNPVAKELFRLMQTKQSNLCLAADLTKTADILNLAAEVGPFLCLLKLHVDIIKDFSKDFIASLKQLAQKHRFLLMEDRKFADIGSVVESQYQDGVYEVSSWADVVTVHALPGPGILQGLRKVMKGTEEKRGMFILAQLSSAGALTTSAYAQDAVKLTEGFEDFLTGFVCQDGSLLKAHPGVIQLTPGVKIEGTGDGLGQQYNTPAKVMGELGGDIAVVGRGIYEAKDAVSAAEIYRTTLWDAYSKRIH
ncbi:uridine 5'-monophosphate synthase [Phlebotomus argentipes]|uniref:uridine 5'-monophosphate synthase n=1 Tax=Phlebotomus argentipes TaxID=94469 RepID=UPI002893479F|nr:uridine 5'-monophosphate synthase [Phlebotomus argentipes]